MKLRFLPVSLLAAFTLLACEEETNPAQNNNDNPGQDTPVAGAITLASTEDVVFSQDGGTAQVTFSATREWTAAVNEDWLSVSPRWGTAGENVSVTITAEANATSEALTATLTLVCVEDEKKVTVILSGPVLSLESSADIVFPEIGGTSELGFSSTKAWTASADADWLTVEPASGEAGNDLSVTLTAVANTTTEKLQAVLTLAAGDETKTVNVILSEPIELPDDPGQGQPEEEGPVVWPESEDAFDFGLEEGATRKADYTGISTLIGGSNKAIPDPITVNGITYGGPGLTFYGTRVTAGQVGSSWSTEYPSVIPSKSYYSFKINRPGTLRFYGAPASKDGSELRVPTYYLAVVTTVKGVTKAKIVREFTPTEMADGTVSENRGTVKPYTEEYQKYWVSMSVTQNDIKGIDEAATVYLFHRNPAVNTLLVHYLPLEWTVGVTTEDETKPKILLAGDSTCTTYTEAAAPQTGWGQCLSDALGGGVVVKNLAIGGESTKSFIDSGKWDNLVATIVANDLVLIQFGHNDAKTDEAHHTDPATTYKENLTKMVNDAKERGGIPVLLTSVNRRYFHSNGDPQRTLGDYPDAMRELAAAIEVPLIDIEQKTYDWLKTLGPEGSEPYYVTNKRDPEKMDNSHLTNLGAQAVADMVAQGLKELNLWE
ncbi:MAG: hypothetical protein J5835_02925 [Bacteroidales bacterium]|nr:hypothetical protein [Bacteroidales bacterium]